MPKYGITSEEAIRLLDTSDNSNGAIDDNGKMPKYGITSEEAIRLLDTSDNSNSAINDNGKMPKYGITSEEAIRLLDTSDNSNSAVGIGINRNDKQRVDGVGRSPGKAIDLAESSSTSSISSENENENVSDSNKIEGEDERKEKNDFIRSSNSNHKGGAAIKMLELDETSSDQVLNSDRNSNNKDESKSNHPSENDNNNDNDSMITSLSSHLAKQGGARIRRIFLMDKNHQEQTEIYTTISTTTSKPTTTMTRKAILKENADDNKSAKRKQEHAHAWTHVEEEENEQVSLESPIGKFWDPSWGSTVDTTVVDAAVPQTKNKKAKIISDAGVVDVDVAPPSMVTPLASSLQTQITPPCDMPVSLASIYWKSLNSSRPREGAWYLNTTMVAANTIPSNSMCQQWMELLTWGPQRTTSASTLKRSTTTTFGNAATAAVTTNQTGFFWDGPRMDHATVVWKQALRSYPSVLLPRMISFSPGGPSEWWKTCLEYDELAAVVVDTNVNTNTNSNEEERGAIGMLRMRSSRLEALIYLLKSNMAFEEEREKLKREPQQQQEKNEKVTIEWDNKDSKKNDISDHSSTNDHDDDESDDEATSNDTRSLVFLQEIRSFGGKVVLRVVAQAMARFWLAQKDFLGYYPENNKKKKNNASLVPTSIRDHHWWSLWQERNDIVNKLASQMVEVLRLMQAIVVTNGAGLSAPALPSGPRRSRRHRDVAQSTTTEKDVRDVLWSAMDMEVQKCLPSNRSTIINKRKRRRPEDELSPRESFLMDWLLALREPLGNSFVENLANQVGLAEEYDDMLNL